MKKIIDLKNFKKYQKSLKGKKIILVGGCFDLFHFGHYFFLENAKKEGDFLIVALESDKFIETKKKRKPIHSQEQRAKILAGLNFVDLVIKLPFFNSNKDYYQLVELIKPKIIAVTQGDPQIKNKKEQAKKIGGEIRVVTPRLDKFSTSEILNIIKESNFL